MKILCIPIRLSQLTTVALLGASLILACSEEAADDTGTYFGYYRGPDRPRQLPTPTGTQAPVSAGGSGNQGSPDDYPDAGAMAGEGNGEAGSASMGDGDGEGMETPPGGDEPCDAPGTILVSRCGAASCHGGAVGDFAESASALESLVGEEPSSNSDECGLMIDPENPEQSFLLTKLNGQLPSGCGAPMPFGTPLTADELDCVESWISQF